MILHLFFLQGYIFVLLNDFATAVNGVVTKQKLESKDLGSFQFLFLCRGNHYLDQNTFKFATRGHCMKGN